MVIGLTIGAWPALMKIGNTLKRGSEYERFSINCSVCSHFFNGYRANQYRANFQAVW